MIALPVEKPQNLPTSVEITTCEDAISKIIITYPLWPLN
jgi:hypothetical protein